MSVSLDPKIPTNRQDATAGHQVPQGPAAEPRPNHPSWCGGVRVCSYILSRIEFGDLGALAVQEFRIGVSLRHGNAAIPGIYRGDGDAGQISLCEDDGPLETTSPKRAASLLGQTPVRAYVTR